MAFEAIEAAETRLELAKRIGAELDGSRPNDLAVREVGDYTIVDDEQDRWIQDTDNFTESAEEFIGEIVKGDRYDGMSVEEIADTEWYTDFCMACGTLYSRIGSPSDIDKLVETLDGDTPMMLEVFEALAIEEEELPAMIRVVYTAGERFHGDRAVEIAKEWISEGFDADEAGEWMAEGFWNPEAAAACRDAGLDSDDAAEAAKKLVEAAGDDNPYTDGDPIYSVCNDDTPVSVLIDAAKAEA
jgi:hypothetical protein